MSRSLTDELRAAPPGLHGEGDEYWGLAWAALRWLEENVRSGMATLETGATVNVPLFVNIGDRVKVDTRSGSYMSRA